MSTLSIIKASAGSGKTHSLTGFFLEILFGEEADYFKGMLAVTFTNKATDEMKNRLIKELYLLSDGQPSEHMDRLLEVTEFSEEHLRSKASAILRHILHEYSWFSVETIDSFFQRIIRAFTRELAIPGNYKIETDTELILNYAVDNLLDSLEPGSQLLNWLVQFSQDKIDEGKLWDIKNDLLALGKEIFKEDFSRNSETIFSLLEDKDKLNDFRRSLQTIIVTTEKKIADLGKSALQVINEHNFEVQDFYYSTRGPVPYFHKLAKGNVVFPNSYVAKLLEASENWPGSKSKRKEEVEAVATKTLLPLLQKIISFIQENSAYYFTAREIQRRLYALGILADINEKISQYRKENDAFILSDAAGFIYKIIDDNDAPFIYEKMGNRYKHFLLDEFQDTSVLQWDNFKPLLSNSLSMGNACLVVGDVKQSIYRWRNSNWEILGNVINREFDSSAIKTSILDTNWRSAENIVTFNNALFPIAAQIVHQQTGGWSTGENTTDISNELLPMYADVRQKVPEKNKEKGWVRMQYFSYSHSKEEPTYYEEPLLNSINNFLDSGFKPGEIAILVRGKKEGKTIVDLLIESNDMGNFHSPVGVISNESLFLEASIAVNILVATLRYLVYPDDDINRGKLMILYRLIHSQEYKENYNLEFQIDQGTTTPEEVDTSLPDEFLNQLSHLVSLPLYELAEHLIRILEIDRLDHELSYVNSFLDLVHDYTRNNPADIVKFLEYWEEEGATKSVSSSESENAIRVLTVHKSKGLEFPVVIVPFCDWEIDQKSTILWVPAKSDAFQFLPVYPVSYGKNLENTEFREFYLSEKFKSYIDNLNLLYVAMTRAVEALQVFPVYRNGKTKEDHVTTVGDIVYRSMQLIPDEKIKAAYDKENEIFELGTLKKKEQEIENHRKMDIVIRSVHATAASERLFFDPRGYEFFLDQLEQKPDMRKKGKTLHTILARIRSSDEIDRSMAGAVYEGLITTEESRELKQHILQCFADPLVASWFDRSGEVINEADIIIGGHETRRPDRVVLFRDHAAVIDYKSGSDARAEEHRRQVEEYMQLMLQMGYERVKGYLWYINSNKVMEV